jgi:SNF family Na+-dependent transporter
MAKNKNKEMSLRLFYYLLFYKLYRPSTLMKSKEEASFVTALIIGFLFVVWSIYVLAAFDFRNHIPKTILTLAFLLSITVNIVFIMKKKKYEEIIKVIECAKIPAFYHILAYLLYSWTFIGIAFL